MTMPCNCKRRADMNLAALTFSVSVLQLDSTGLHALLVKAFANDMDHADWPMSLPPKTAKGKLDWEAHKDTWWRVFFDVDRHMSAGQISDKAFDVQLILLQMPLVPQRLYSRLGQKHLQYERHLYVDSCQRVMPVHCS